MSRIDDQLNDLVIVSAYGRGNWLASELATRGWKVSLVDVSERLGPCEPEEVEGPFGLFEASDVLASQKNRLTAEGETSEAPHGFTVWLKEGPLELRSELTAFQLGARGIPSSIDSHLRRASDPGKDIKRERRKIISQFRESFDSSWLFHLAHQFASNVYRENHIAAESGAVRPLFAPFSVRQATAAGIAKGLQACVASGVRVRAKATIKDVRLVDRTIDAIEVEDSRSGSERGRSFVWALTGAETAKICPSAAESLFPDGVVEASWFWARFRVGFSGRVFKDLLPLHAVLIGDLYLPWTHANFLVVRRAPVEKPELDVWVRLPARVRGNTDYISKTNQQIESMLTVRFPQSVPKVLRGPSETANWPVFSEGELSDLYIIKSSTLFFDGPEQWEALDWLAAFRHQSSILVRLERLKAQWDAAAQKAELQAKQRAERNQRSPNP